MRPRNLESPERGRFPSIVAVAVLLLSVATALLLASDFGRPALVAAGALASAAVAAAVTVLASVSEERLGAARHRVFLSYALEDRAKVLPLVEAMQAAGLSLWDPAAEILPGDRLEERVREGLRDSETMVVFLSDHLSPWVAFEVGHAQGSGKRIVPVVIDPKGLSAARELAPEIIHLDVSEGSEGVANKLVESVRAAR